MTAAIEDQAQTFRHTFQKLRSELSKVLELVLVLDL